MKAKEVVLSVDTDGDGKLNEAEASQALSAMGIFLTQEEERAWLATLPFKNGMCRAEDLVPSLDEQATKRNPRVKLQEMFRTFDHNNSGYINQREFMEVLKTIGGLLTPAEQQELVALAASNNKINYVELINMLM